jgi:hypothetical protein
VQQFGEVVYRDHRDWWRWDECGDLDVHGHDEWDDIPFVGCVVGQLVDGVGLFVEAKQSQGAGDVGPDGGGVSE